MLIYHVSLLSAVFTGRSHSILLLLLTLCIYHDGPVSPISCSAQKTRIGILCDYDLSTTTEGGPDWD